MMKTLLRAGALSCALMATTCLTPSPAAAQSLTGPTARPAPDANGVDVITGRLNGTLRAVSIGRPGESGLAYVNGFSDGYRQDSFELSLIGGNSFVSLNIHGRIVNFSKDGSGTYVPAEADGATLTLSSGNYTYTGRDGTRIVFSPNYGDTGRLVLIKARGTTITRPDGEVLTYHYRTEVGIPCQPGIPCHNDKGGVRVQSVTSSLGFQLKAYYATDTWNAAASGEWLRLTRVVALNNAVDRCFAAADTCPSFSQDWPELVLGRSTSGSTTTDTLTDNLSNTVTATSQNGLLTELTSPADPAADLAVTYDGSQRVSTLTRGNGTWTYGYADTTVNNVNLRTTTVAQPGGGDRIYVSDRDLKRVLSVTNELGRTTSFQYDGHGRRTRVTRPEGDYTQVTYDARGNVTETRHVAKSGSGLADIVTTASFAASCANALTCNQPASVTDARGNTTDFTYDANHGGVLTATAPAVNVTVGGTTYSRRPQTRFAYAQRSAWYRNGAGTIVQAATPVYRLTATSACRTGTHASGSTPASCIGTADEVKASLDYGTGSSSQANNLFVLSATAGAGDGSLSATTTNSYDAIGNLLTIDGPLAGTADTSATRYDALRRPTMTISPDPDGAGPLLHRAQRITYDADGNVAKVESGTTSTLGGAFTAAASGERVEYSYDSLGRQSSVRLMSGASTIQALSQTSYDSKGRPECTVQRMNPAAFASPPASACTLGTAGSAGPDRIVRTVYDHADQVTQVQAAYGTSDQANEVTATYRSNGQAETLTDGEGNMTTYVYDGHDRLSRTRYPSSTTDGVSSTTDYEEPTYDAAGNVTNRRLRDGQSIAFTYDALNRPTLKNLPGSEPDVSYGYDLLGQMLSASQSGHALSFGYDALGRPLTQTGPQGTITSAFDLAGRRTRITHPDGFYVDQDYLVTGEMAKIRENGATTGVGVLATFAYDDQGRRTSLTRGNGTSVSYGYDAVSRLSQLAENMSGTAHDLTLGFGYNPADQIASNTRSNDLYAQAALPANHQTTPVDGLNRIVSVNGVNTGHDARGNLTAESGRTYAYTSENLLASATHGSTTTFVYDPLMRLQRLVGASGPNFVYDGMNLTLERDAGTNAVQRRYVHGPGVDEPLVQYEGSGTSDRRFLHADERGSIVAHSDNSGAVVAVNRYDEYGQPHGPSGAGTLAGRFGYTGQAWLPEVGLWYYRARMYNARLGRFLQPDPIGYGDGMNMYAYVGGDPVNGTDPTGMCEPSRIGAAPGSICGGTDNDPSYEGSTARRELEKILAEKRRALAESGGGGGGGGGGGAGLAGLGQSVAGLSGSGGLTGAANQASGLGGDIWVTGARARPAVILTGGIADGLETTLYLAQQSSQPRRPPRPQPRPRPQPAPPTSMCDALRAMSGTGNAMMAAGTVIGVGGLITPGIPDGEAIGLITAGMGALSWLVGEGGVLLLRVTKQC